MAASHRRLPNLTAAQAMALLDLLDALTDAVGRAYGDAIAAHDLRVSPRRRRRPPPAGSPAAPAPVLPRTPGPPPRCGGASVCVAGAEDEETV